MSNRTKRIERLVKFAWEERYIRRHHAKMNFQQFCKIGELRDALRPFAEFSDTFKDANKNNHGFYSRCIGGVEKEITYGDFRRARKAVEQ